MAARNGKRSAASALFGAAPRRGLRESEETEEVKMEAPGKRRKAKGKAWVDESLDEWPEHDFRLFCGDLGPEVTTDLLRKTFKQYDSFTKAHVVKDKRTSKSKGYGFVSFLNAADYAKAYKDWNGKYIGTRPVKLRKSTWKDRIAKK